MNYVTLQVKAFFGVCEDWEVKTENLHLSQNTLQNSFFPLYKEREKWLEQDNFGGKKFLQIFGLTFYSNFTLLLLKSLRVSQGIEIPLYFYYPY